MKKRKPTRAQQEAQASFDALIRKWANVPKFAHSNRPIVSVQKPVTTPSYPPGREPQSISSSPDRSFADKWAGGTKAVHGLRYTGDKMIGVAVMHKSNSVPVFNGEAAVELARMRRG